MKHKKSLFSLTMMSGQKLKTDYKDLRDTLGCFSRQIESVVI